MLSLQINLFPSHEIHCSSHSKQSRIYKSYISSFAHKTEPNASCIYFKTSLLPKSSTKRYIHQKIYSMILRLRVSINEGKLFVPIFNVCLVAALQLLLLCPPYTVIKFVPNFSVKTQNTHPIIFERFLSRL